jgi:hypothetical protein
MRFPLDLPGDAGSSLTPTGFPGASFPSKRDYISKIRKNDTNGGLPPASRQPSVADSVSRSAEEGKIVEDWTNFDALGLMQQLGLVPEQR